MLDNQSGYYKGNFNSIKVRLELLFMLLRRLLLRYFNSIKVRLELSIHSEDLNALAISIP